MYSHNGNLQSNNNEIPASITIREYGKVLLRIFLDKKPNEDYIVCDCIYVKFEKLTKQMNSLITSRAGHK